MSLSKMDADSLTIRKASHLMYVRDYYKEMLYTIDEPYHLKDNYESVLLKRICMLCSAWFKTAQKLRSEYPKADIPQYFKELAYAIAQLRYLNRLDLLDVFHVKMVENYLSYCASYQLLLMDDMCSFDDTTRRNTLISFTIPLEEHMHCPDLLSMFSIKVLDHKQQMAIGVHPDEPYPLR